MIFRAIKKGYQKLSSALKGAGSLFSNKLRSLFSSDLSDQKLLEKMEELFYESDFGVELAEELSLSLKSFIQEQKGGKVDTAKVIEHIRFLLIEQLNCYGGKETPLSQQQPHVVVLVGVNGNGKTTSCAKLAKLYKDEGKKVLLCGADTYRAAASEQLKIWSEKLSVDLVQGQRGADAAAVAFDAASAAKSRGCELLVVDTAGRLHTKTPLMHELQKLSRSLAKAVSGAPHETLLVLDATQGQNAVEQARTFNHYIPLTGILLTKLDGTAKGGTIFQIQRQLKVPLRFIGVGEGAEDLQHFSAEAFVDALLNP